MSIPGLDGDELIAWVNRTSLGWRELFAEHPEALAVPCDIRETADVRGLIQHIVANHDDAWWSDVIEFVTRSAGTMRATRRAIIVHLLTHSLRHYAQLATLVRQHGIAPSWPMDYLGMTPQG